MTDNLRHTAIALSAASLLALSSCLSKGVVVRADRYDDETIVDLMNEEEPVLSHIDVNKPHVSSAKKNSAVKSAIDGEWVIVEAAGKKVSVDDDQPYVIFSDKEGRFYASNGCNIINGEYAYGDNTLTMGNVVSTMRMCPDPGYQRTISSVLNDGVSVKTRLEDKGRETYLYLTSNSGDKLLTLRRNNLEVINGQWEVHDIEGVEVDGSEINLFIDIAERAVHGNTGCNYFNGAIVIDPGEPDAISFSQMGVTMRYCDNADTERMLLVALEETEKYQLKDQRTTLILADGTGRPLVTLKRVEQQ